MPLLCFTKMCGSLLYMAPEVFSGHLYDERCDVYAMAIVYYELLTRQPLDTSLGLTTHRKMFKMAERVRTRHIQGGLYHGAKTVRGKAVLPRYIAT
jgi:serine/threonine protein kinase